MSKAILLAVLILLAGCGGPEPVETGSAKAIYSGPDGKVFRVIDEDAAVVCWIYRDYYRGGIDCMSSVVLTSREHEQ